MAPLYRGAASSGYVVVCYRVETERTLFSSLGLDKNILTKKHLECRCRVLLWQCQALTSAKLLLEGWTLVRVTSLRLSYFHQYISNNCLPSYVLVLQHDCMGRLQENCVGVQNRFNQFSMSCFGPEMLVTLFV